MRTVHLFNGRSFVLVPRAQLRRTTSGRTLRLPSHLRALMASVPTPPLSWDGSKSRTIKYPILGNDQYGDCYLADALHCVQTWTGGVGAEATFDPAAVIKLYLQLSGGDNGLSDSDIFPAWKAGLFGHKILDEMTVDPRDDAAIRLGMWSFGGASWTCALPDAWIDAAEPGAVWDTGRPNQTNGHAMHLSGYDPLYYQDETWGFDPAICLTPSGLKSADPEVTVQFSLDQFNASGVAPNGMNYTAAAALWKTLGGGNLPPSPFVPPAPPSPPTPPPTPASLFSLNFAHALAAGSSVQFRAPVRIPAGKYEVVPTAKK